MEWLVSAVWKWTKTKIMFRSTAKGSRGLRQSRVWAQSGKICVHGRAQMHCLILRWTILNVTWRRSWWKIGTLLTHNTITCKQLDTNIYACRICFTFSAHRCFSHAHPARVIFSVTSSSCKLWSFSKLNDLGKMAKIVNPQGDFIHIHMQQSRKVTKYTYMRCCSG